MTCPPTRALWSSIFLNPASTSTTSQALGPPRRTISGAQSVATWVSYASCFTTAWSFFLEKNPLSLAILCDLFGMVKWPPNRDQKVTVWITWSLSWDEMKQPMMSWWFALLVYYPRKSSSKGNKNTWRCPSRLHQPTVRHWGSTLIVFCWIPVDFFSHDLTSFWGVVVQHGFVASSWSVAYQAYHIKFIESNSLKTSLFIRICDSADNLSFPNPCHFKRTWSRTKYKRGMTYPLAN